MGTRIKRLFCVALLSAGFVVSLPVNADVNLMFGIYAADQRVKKMWQCGILVEAMEEHMSATLEDTVSIEIEINQNYDAGVDAVTSGLVEFARFPNVERGWVIHPDVQENVVAAWRAAFTELGFERLPYLASPQVFYEGNYGYCYELERLAQSARTLSAVQY